MREVANRLERMGCINRDIRLVAANTGPSCDRLLSLRADFSFEANQLLGQLTGKLLQTEQAQLASRILDAFVSMQKVILRHQQDWPFAEVERDPEGYVASTHEVQAAVIGFLEDALEELDQAARPTREQRAAHSPAALPAPIRRTANR